MNNMCVLLVVDIQLAVNLCQDVSKTVCLVHPLILNPEKDMIAIAGKVGMPWKLSTQIVDDEHSLLVT